MAATYRARGLALFTGVRKERMSALAVGVTRLMLPDDGGQAEACFAVGECMVGHGRGRGDGGGL